MLGGVLVIPRAVVDQHIKMAGSAQLKVLLWFSAQGCGEFDPELCSSLIGLSPADCSDALSFWIETGVLIQNGGAADPVPVPPREQPVLPAATPPTQPAAPASQPVLPSAQTAKKFPLTQRQQPVKPQLPEVLERRKACPEFADLLQTAETRLGKPVTPGDMETLLYLYDSIGMPAAVILMIIVYALSMKKNSMRYIEKIALDWAERGINTVAAAELHLCALERQRACWVHLSSLLELKKEHPSAAQMESARIWIDDWQLPDELIREAYTQGKAKTGQFQHNYMMRILDTWRAEGVKTAEDARAFSEPRKKPKGKPLLADSENSSLDTDEYEQMVQNYRPVYKKKIRNAEC